MNYCLLCFLISSVLHEYTITLAKQKSLCTPASINITLTDENPCECFCLVNNSGRARCNKCGLSNELQQITSNNPPMPNDSNVYYFSKISRIWCLNGTIKLNSSEYHESQYSQVLIGGLINKSNQTICAYCLYKTTRSTWRCYFIIYETPRIIVQPFGKLYHVNKTMKACCKILPYEYSKYFSYPSIIFSKNNETGIICIKCQHITLGNKTKCFTPFGGSVKVKLIEIDGFQGIFKFKCVLVPNLYKTKNTEKPTIEYIDGHNMKKINIETFRLNSPMVLYVICRHPWTETVISCHDINSGLFSKTQETSYIIPNTSTLNYMIRPNINCVFSNLHNFTGIIKITVSGLKFTDYIKKRTGIEIMRYIYLVGKTVCVDFFYPKIINSYKCYELIALIMFYHHPRFEYYRYDITKTISTYFLFHVNKLSSICLSDNKDVKINITDGEIHLYQKMPNMIYKFRCHLNNSRFYRNLSINIYDGPMALIFIPSQSIIIIKTKVRISCQTKPYPIHHSRIRIYTEDTFEYELEKNTIILKNSLLFHSRCLCFKCIGVDLGDISRCYIIKTSAALNQIPYQKLYFSLKQDHIQIHFMDIYKVNRTYPAMCTFSIHGNFIFELNLIIVTSTVPNGTYDLECKIPNFSYSEFLRINIYALDVIVTISPTDSDIYVIDVPLIVQCRVSPHELLNILPDIRFMEIGSSGSRYISQRDVIIEGSNNTNHSTICLKCGHQYMPQFDIKCFNPYEDNVNVTISPLTHQLRFMDSEIIKCDFQPKFTNDSFIQFKLIRLQNEYYKRRDNLIISVNKDSSLIGRNICAICGNVTKMNATKCFILIGSPKGQVMYLVAVFAICLCVIGIMVYIQKNEVM